MKLNWLQSIRDWFVTDVPDDIAACEFDCRTLDCDGERWESCERRLAKQDALAQSGDGTAQTNNSCQIHS